jgi:purine-binding chemotaxis protein CheW
MDNQQDDKDLDEYLSFELGQEIYALNILNVKEIKTYDEVTPVANSPDFVKGVMNLRGTIVPVLDLRVKFDLGSREYTKQTTVIITTIEGGSGDRHVGLVVDGVSDVLKVNKKEISSSPEFNSTLDVEYLEGITTVDEVMVILIDIHKLLTNKEMGLVDEIQEEMSGGE